jgi:hypothetical protein
MLALSTIVLIANAKSRRTWVLTAIVVAQVKLGAEVLPDTLHDLLHKTAVQRMLLQQPMRVGDAADRNHR